MDSLRKVAGGESVCSIGFFDGVHRGHRYLIQQVKDEAARRGARSLLVTFDRHPREVFAPESAPALLTTPDEKMHELRATGVDDIYVLHFDHHIAGLTAREFMRQVLSAQLGVSTLVIGYDHHFGRPQGEGFEDYRTYGAEMGIEVVQARELEGEHVSSSAIRRALQSGDVAVAAQLLGHAYTWTGRVVHGHAIGRLLGFPTANLTATEPSKVLPAKGAYAVHVEIQAPEDEGEGLRPSQRKFFSGMLNIGSRPTIDNGADISVEVHLFDFHADLYGQRLTLHFASRLREELRFESEEQLSAQLQQDMLEAKRRLQEQ